MAWNSHLRSWSRTVFLLMLPVPYCEPAAASKFTLGFFATLLTNLGGETVRVATENHYST